VLFVGEKIITVSSGNVNLTLVISLAEGSEHAALETKA
jgi:hypothetical protein